MSRRNDDVKSSMILIIIIYKSLIYFKSIFLINFNANYDYYFDKIYIIFINFDFHRFMIFKILDRHNFANRIEKNVFFDDDDFLN